MSAAPQDLKKSQRRSQVAAILAQAAAQAFHFEIEAEQLHQLLDEQIALLAQGGPHD